MTRVNQKKLIEFLPFDQYSRQLIVSRLIDDAVRPSLKKEKLQIIDLGGHKGKTHDFQPNDKVTILDVFDVSYKDYVKGDATKTDFANNHFDIAVSFDVFEHIPREKRKAFIKEALRISKFGIFLAMPIDTDNKVVSAEILLNNFYKTIFNKEHPWLKEHIDYRIPNEKEIQTLVSSVDGDMVSVSSNQFGDWQLMQMLIFASANNSDITKEARQSNIWYNQHIEKLDANVDVGYRKVFFISKNNTHITTVRASIEKFSKQITKDDYITVHREAFEEFAHSFAVISKKYSELHKQFTKSGGEVNKLHGKLNEASDHITKLTAEINAIYASPSWKVAKPIRGIERLNGKLKTGRRKSGE